MLLPSKCRLSIISLGSVILFSFNVLAGKAADTAEIMDLDTVPTKSTNHPVRVSNSKSNQPDDTVFIDEAVPQKVRVSNSRHMETSLPVESVDLSSPHNSSGPSKGNIITGACLFGVPYCLSIIVGSLISTNEYNNGFSSYFYIPVIGPLLVYFNDNHSSDSDTPEGLLCAGWTTAQSIGVFLLIKGIAGQEREHRFSQTQFHLAPTYSRYGSGFAVQYDFDPN